MAAKEKKTKDFSNPKKLGFMRVLQVIWIIALLLSVLTLVVESKNDFNLDYYANLRSIAQIMVQSVALWLLSKRKAATRTWVIGYSIVFCILAAIGTVMRYGFNSFAFALLVPTVLMYGLDAVYFATSRRAKAVLVQPMDMNTREAEFKAHRSLFQPKTWEFWRNLIMYFCVFSVVGHWMEAFYCTFIRLGIIPGTYDPNSQIWSDWLYPFCVYGVGAVCCVLLFYPVRLFLQAKIKKPVVPVVLSFVWNGFICTCIEYIMGILLNHPDPVTGKLQLWDYSDMFCNFQGQVCLQNAVAFGAIATLMTWVIYPSLEYGIAKLPKDVATNVFVGIVVGFVLLFALYCMTLF